MSCRWHTRPCVFRLSSLTIYAVRNDWIGFLEWRWSISRFDTSSLFTKGRARKRPWRQMSPKTTKKTSSRHSSTSLSFFVFFTGPCCHRGTSTSLHVHIDKSRFVFHLSRHVTSKLFRHHQALSYNNKLSEWLTLSFALTFSLSPFSFDPTHIHNIPNCVNIAVMECAVLYACMFLFRSHLFDSQWLMIFWLGE